VASVSQSQQLPEFRLLLDQGFPKPPGFAVRAVDRTVEVVHLHDYDASLSDNSTPDWMLYCVAAEAGFDALVARDRSQLDQLAEMFVLSRLTGFAVITWRRPIEDPIREWGQLLAYLPEVKKYLKEGPCRAILLPAPTLSSQNLHNPVDTIGMEAQHRGISNTQARRLAQAEIHEGLELSGDDPHRFDQLLRL
jgi:hypothetical protein